MTLRRALDGASADPLTHEECRNRLFGAQQAFHGWGELPANMAAGIAAQAAQYALPGYPGAMVKQVGAAGEEAHQRALAEVEVQHGFHE